MITGSSKTVGDVKPGGSLLSRSDMPRAEFAHALGDPG